MKRRYVIDAVVRDTTKVAPSEFGRVVGFGRNDHNELTVLVQWEFSGTRRLEKPYCTFVLPSDIVLL